MSASGPSRCLASSSMPALESKPVTKGAASHETYSGNGL